MEINLKISISEALKGNNMNEIPSENVNTVYKKMQQTDTVKTTLMS